MQIGFCYYTPGEIYQTYRTDASLNSSLQSYDFFYAYILGKSYCSYQSQYLLYEDQTFLQDYSLQFSFYLLRILLLLFLLFAFFTFLLFFVYFTFFYALFLSCFFNILFSSGFTLIILSSESSSLTSLSSFPIFLISILTTLSNFFLSFLFSSIWPLMYCSKKYLSFDPESLDNIKLGVQFYTFINVIYSFMRFFLIFIRLQIVRYQRPSFFYVQLHLCFVDKQLYVKQYPFY